MNSFLRTILGPASFPRKRKQTPAEAQVKPQDTKPGRFQKDPVTSLNKEPDNGIRKRSD